MSKSLLDSYAEIIEQTYGPMVKELERHNAQMQRTVWIAAIVIGVALVLFFATAVIK